MKKYILLLCIWMISSCWASAAQLLNFSVSDTPLSIAVKGFDNQTQSYSKKRVERELRKHNVRWVSHLMAAAITFYQATKQERFLDMSEEIFRCAMQLWKEDEELMSGRDDFFSIKHVAYTYERLKTFGRLKGEECKETVIKFAELHFDPQFITDHNRAQERALGFVRMYNLFPEAPQSEEWKKYADAMWNYWYRNKDIDETATLYAAIHLNDILTIAKESGRMDLLKDDRIEQWFARYLHQQAPSGYMPEYGDDYFFAYFDWILVFEKMARVTGNSQFHEAAVKLYKIGLSNLPEKYTKQGWFLRDACEWASLAEVALLPAVEADAIQLSDWGALVTTRTNRYGKSDIPDQLLLAASHVPGSPFVMSDLYANGSHRHSNLRGTINYYETDCCPHFHGVQRHATDMRHGNTVVLMEEEGNGFPYGENSNRWLTNRWFTDWVDFSTAAHISKKDPSMRGFKNITFRFQNGQPGERIYIDNVRLYGKAGERILHDCNKLEAWGKGVELVDNGKGGKMICITLTDRDVHFFNLHVSADFSLSDYRYIGCDWLHCTPDGRQKSPFSFKIRVYNKVKDALESYVDEEVGTLPNPNIVREAKAENKGSDSYGEIILDDHCTDGTVLQRRMVLTAEGVLILQDYLIPGENTDGFVAGSLWQLYQLSESGENWFATSGGKRIYRDESNAGKTWRDSQGNEIARRQLLVYFEKQKEFSYGYQKQEYTIKPTTVFSKCRVAAHKPVTFVMVVIPYRAGEKAVEIVKDISVETINGKSHIEFIHDKKKVKVDLSLSGAWNVSR